MSVEYSLMTRQIRWAQLHLGYQEAGREPEPDRVGTRHYITLIGTYTQEFPGIQSVSKRERQKGREGGKERKLKDYDLCNAGKPINGGVCE